MNVTRLLLFITIYILNVVQLETGLAQVKKSYQLELDINPERADRGYFDKKWEGDSRLEIILKVFNQNGSSYLGTYRFYCWQVNGGRYKGNVNISLSEEVRDIIVDINEDDFSGDDEVGLAQISLHNNTIYNIFNQDNLQNGYIRIKEPSLVVILGGEFQDYAKHKAGDRTGIYTIGEILIQKGYDVLLLDEDEVSDGSGTFFDVGSGTAFNEIRKRISENGKISLAIIGYSHGGGGVFNLTDKLEEVFKPGIDYEIAFTGYIDAISALEVNGLGESKRPKHSKFHLNFYQIRGANSCFPITKFIANCIKISLLTWPYGEATKNGLDGRTENINVNSVAWGKNLDHCTIDDAPQIINRMVREVENHLKIDNL